ncbi:MAG: SGNH/GDSL hydrolase family protein [Actinobacteria bacterium]|nr:SGNH/GDSL hydrolase family protein [Actinomycetota bacterium]
MAAATVALVLLGGTAGAVAADRLPRPLGARTSASPSVSPPSALGVGGDPAAPEVAGAGEPVSTPFGAVVDGGSATPPGATAVPGATPPGATAVPVAPAAAVPVPPPPAKTAEAAPVTPSAAGGTYHVVGLGDSVPAGTACGCATYVSLAGRARAAELGRTPDVADLAVPGMTTAGLVDQLADPDVASAVADADLVIVTIGANDFDPDDVSTDACAAPGLDCYRPQLDAQAGELDTVLDTIATLEADHPATVVLTGYWNVFLDGDVGRAQGAAYVAASDALTVADNAVIEAAAGRHGATYVDLYAPFRGTGATDDTALLAADGDHPDAAGHRLIARTIEAALG